MKTIYDNVHRQYTSWPDVIVQLLNTPEFQRLKRIKQLSACHYVFPGATHTRFEHSLGVGYLAAKFVRTLATNQPELSIGLSDGRETTLETAILAFQLAGLCHDLGHATLSHGFDTLVTSFDPPVQAHEARSVALLRYIVTQYKLPIPSSVVETACELIYPERKADNTLPTWWYQIIANDQDSIDVDKFDYLLRDAHALGIGGIDVDIERFIEYGRVCPVDSISGDMCLCYPTKLQFDVNQLFLARHRLHAQVYQHPAVRAIEKMLQDFLVCIKRPLEEDLQASLTHPPHLCTWTDDVFTRPFLDLLVAQGRVESDHAAKAWELLERIERRQLYRQVSEVRIPRQLTIEKQSELDMQSIIDGIETHTSIVVGSSVWQREWYTDAVMIGYALNPLYRVRFYDVDITHKKHTAKHVPLGESSYTFPVCSRDTIVRIYCKSIVRPTQQMVDSVKKASTLNLSNWVNEQ